jgi:hypothetical protein
MKISVIGHASLLIEANGVTILSDPWWRGPCFGAQWWNYPPPAVPLLAGRRIDYIYISHGHHDHLHPGTLRTLGTEAKVLVSRRIGIADSIRELGFEVIEIDDSQELSLAPGLDCRVIATHGHDTLMALSDGREVCINLNDALHSAPQPVRSDFVSRLNLLYPKIDYVFCGYGVASHFPNCYEIPGKDREATASLRQKYFNRNWAGLIAGLSPRFGFPFAADVVFLEDDLRWVNEVTHNSERPTQLFNTLHPRLPVRALDVAPGFVIEDGQVSTMALREPLSDAALRISCAESIERANRLGRVEQADVLEILGLIRENLDSAGAYPRSYDGDYRFLIRFRNSDFGIDIVKVGEQVTAEIRDLERTAPVGYDIVYRTRLPYLKRALTDPFGDEILFVGSGGIFEYTDQSQARHNLHRELRYFLAKPSSPEPMRGPRPNTLISVAKNLVKRAMGRGGEDLYDLNRWTVFR